MQHKLIAFIGGGNMAQAIVLGLLKQGYPAEQIIVNDPNETKRAFFAELGVQTAQDNAVSAKRADAVLLAVKPQMMAEVCRCLAGVDFSDKLLISIRHFYRALASIDSECPIRSARDAKYAGTRKRRHGRLVCG